MPTAIEWMRGTRAWPLSAVLAAVAATGCASAPRPGEDGTLHLQGAASTVVNDCHFDGVCTVTVQGVVVTTMAGFRSDPAPVWGQSSGQPTPGQQVEVWCRKTGPRSCTLQGNPAYYLRAVP